jgi:hypothetical protein
VEPEDLIRTGRRRDIFFQRIVAVVVVINAKRVIKGMSQFVAKDKQPVL